MYFYIEKVENTSNKAFIIWIDEVGILCSYHTPVVAFKNGEIYRITKCDSHFTKTTMTHINKSFNQLKLKRKDLIDMSVTPINELLYGTTK